MRPWRCGTAYTSFQQPHNTALGVYMINSESIKKDFYNWIDQAVSMNIPDETKGFHFNFYEGEDSVHIQLFGMKSFESGEDPVRDYWPGNETFSTEENVFEIPYEILGEGWESWLEKTLEFLKEYLVRGNKSKVLKRYQGVGAGFVDGDMYLIWSN